MHLMVGIKHMESKSFLSEYKAYLIIGFFIHPFDLLVFFG